MSQDQGLEIKRAGMRLRAAAMRLDALGDAESKKAVEEARAVYQKALSDGKQPDAARASEGTPARRGGEQMGADTTGLEARVALRMENVPTSMAHVLARDGVPLVSVSVANTSDEKTARVAVKCWVEGFSATAIRSREIPAGETETFDLFPPFFPDRIRGLTEMAIASLHVEVWNLDEKMETVASYPLPLLAPSTAVLFQLDPKTGKEIDLTDKLTAWVTPNAPEILTFLRTCADFSKLKAMLGYQIPPDGIREHVRAIYDALKAASIVYINSPIAFGGGSGQFIQRVRLPRESLAQRSANCIDGTVLMASLLEATGLDPAIVLIPGHAYLGFRPDQTKDVWEYVETTMIGTESFEKACQTADATTQRSASASAITLIDVRACRGRGVMPME